MADILDFHESVRKIALKRALKRLRVAERMLELEYSMRFLVQVNQAKLLIILLEGQPNPHWVVRQVRHLA